MKFQFRDLQIGLIDFGQRQVFQLGYLPKRANIGNFRIPKIKAPQVSQLGKGVKIDNFAVV